MLPAKDYCKKQTEESKSPDEMPQILHDAQKTYKPTF